MGDKRRVIITMEQGRMFGEVFQDDIMADLKEHADVVLNDLGRRFTTEELAERCGDVDAIITAWGTPAIDMSVVNAAPKLKVIGHAAGSIKGSYNPGIWDAGIRVTTASYVMGVQVGEFALLATLALLRTLPQYAYGVPKGTWDGIACVGWETLVGKTVGLIGLGQTGRSYLRFLAPFDCNVIAYDPYMKPEAAKELGVELVSLERLLSTAKVISLHAPITEETKNMLNAEKLKLISDGAVFVNTARGVLIDHDALADELETGRFKAALDVTYPEPLPEDHRLRKLPNCLLTPHVAGPTVDSRRDMFRSVVEDFKLFWSGQPMKNEITKNMLATMA